ncbi:MAG: neutral/alkaline non-lysosomal ceramidase N-terminal domain-containing protein [Clostridia bacterium]|nr:neutral/alkaline non-lysosomal ceramidase N-terminal domain-containing protein [Clostridia bacterium]
MSFLTGVSRKEITPEVGGNLYGYHDKIFSERINDRLFVTAFCFADEQQKVLLISCDVCLLHNTISDRIRREIAHSENIPFENILIHAIHTHTGPNTAGEEGWGKIDMPYCESIFIPTVLESCHEACSNMQQAKMGYATTDSKVGINRRQLLPNGTVDLGQNPWGVYDPTMSVVSFIGEDKQPLFNLIHYGAHNTACGAITTISRDWCGVAIDRLADLSGGVTAFFNGCEGDTGPRLPNGKTVGGMQYALELGGLAAIDAVRAWKNIKTYTTPAITVLPMQAKLPLQPRISLQEAKDGYEKFKEFDVNLNRQTAHYYEQVIAAYESNIPQEEYRTVNLSLVQLGDIVIVPFAYEMFTEISLRIKAAFPHKHILCMSNTNGNNSYFPSADQIIRGGYEVQMFKTGNGLQAPVDNADDYLVQAIVRKMEEL